MAQEIRKGELNHLSNCIKICLAENKIHLIGNESFVGMEKLEVLILSWNSIRVVHGGMWQGKGLLHLFTFLLLSRKVDTAKQMGAWTGRQEKTPWHIGSTFSNPIYTDLRDDTFWINIG